MTQAPRADVLPQVGDLRVWWVPQVPMQPFYAPVRSPREARDMLEALSRYDQFQLENNIKPDFCNAGGLQTYEADDGCGSPGWSEWCDNDTGESIDEIHEPPDLIATLRAERDALAQALQRIAAVEPTEGKASKNRGAMLQMQAIARAALDPIPKEPTK